MKPENPFPNSASLFPEKNNNVGSIGRDGQFWTLCRKIAGMQL